MPVSTVRSIVGRRPANHPKVRDAAIRFQLVPPVDLESLPVPVPLGLLDDLLEGKPYPAKGYRGGRSHGAGALRAVGF